MKGKLIVGDLDVGQEFTLKDQSTIYRAITVPQRKANPWYGTRWCMNLETNETKKIKCKEEVTLNNNGTV